ncbi:MAG: LysR family transcriptional regulator [Polyangiales bacterium]
MDLYQLKTFVTVAREGSVTRASEALHLSQPAVSAHIKAMEDTLGLSLFERTPCGMSLTADGRRLLSKAEQTLAAHQELLAEANRTKGELGSAPTRRGTNASHEAVGRLLTALAARHPAVEVELKHKPSQEVLAALRGGAIDAGFYNEPATPDPDLAVVEVARFTTLVVAAPGLVSARPLAWESLAALPWIYPTEAACCGHAARSLFAAHRFTPSRVVSADRQDITRALVASGLGVGLLHDDTARAAERAGEVEVLYETDTPVRVLFAHLASRAHDPLLAAATSILRAKSL